MTWCTCSARTPPPRPAVAADGAEGVAEEVEVARREALLSVVFVIVCHYVLEIS